MAKRLIDCGFHAPTMSWPVAGTLMIEPTESEPKAELDRFFTAMLAIREEARAIEEGRMDRENNPLKRAPHTVEDLVGDWDRPYSREQACYPPGAFRVDKYWAPVNRVDNVWGDRNLICSCPPVESYAGGGGVGGRTRTAPGPLLRAARRRPAAVQPRSASMIATSSALMPGSDRAWPAPVTILSVEPGQAWCSRCAVCGGQIMS